MILDANPMRLANEIGHDGLEQKWPLLSYPFCSVGYHIQEMQDVCFTRGKLLAKIEPVPLSAPYANAKPHYVYKDFEKRFKNMIKGSRALIITEKHAVAWDGAWIYDPNGVVYELDKVDEIREAWLLCTRNSSKNH